MSENRPFRRGRPTLQERVDGTAGPLLPRQDTPATRVGHAWEEHEQRLADLRRQQGAHRAAADPTPKHCWVLDDPRWPGRRAGLLLGWQRTSGGWVGRVVLAPAEDVELAVVLVPSNRLAAT